MSSPYRMLLVESDDYSIDVLERFIRSEFPELEVVATPPAETMEVLEGNRYHILVCDAYLQYEEKVSFVADLCREKGLILIVITGHHEITTETFSPHISGSCIHDVLYRPLDLKELGQTIQCALQRVRATKAEPTG